MRTLAAETASASASTPTIATSAYRATLRCLIPAQSDSEGRQLGSVVGNRSTSSVSSNRSRTIHFATPSVSSLQTKVGATISGGKSVSSSGYLISRPPAGSLGNASGAGPDPFPQALRDSAAMSSRPLYRELSFICGDCGWLVEAASNEVRAPAIYHKPRKLTPRFLERKNSSVGESSRRHWA